MLRRSWPIYHLSNTWNKIRMKFFRSGFKPHSPKLGSSCLWLLATYLGLLQFPSLSTWSLKTSRFEPRTRIFSNLTAGCTFSVMLMSLYSLLHVSPLMGSWRPCFRCILPSSELSIWQRWCPSASIMSPLCFSIQNTWHRSRSHCSLSWTMFYVHHYGLSLFNYNLSIHLENSVLGSLRFHRLASQCLVTCRNL